MSRIIQDDVISEDSHSVVDTTATEEEPYPPPPPAAAAAAIATTTTTGRRPTAQDTTGLDPESRRQLKGKQVVAAAPQAAAEASSALSLSPPRFQPLDPSQLLKPTSMPTPTSTHQHPHPESVSSHGSSHGSNAEEGGAGIEGPTGEPKRRRSLWDQFVKSIGVAGETATTTQPTEQQQRMAEAEADDEGQVSSPSVLSSSEDQPSTNQGRFDRKAAKASKPNKAAAQQQQPFSSSELTTTLSVEEDENAAAAKGTGRGPRQGPPPSQQQQREWLWQRYLAKLRATLAHLGTAYNLYAQRYLHPERHQATAEAGNSGASGFWVLRSGLPFPSYHSNPVEGFPARVSSIEGARDTCEELRAPRIRLGPTELDKKQWFLVAMEQKADENVEQAPPKIKSLNLGYQNLGEAYQYEQLLAFLKINRGVTTLALNDNFLSHLREFESLPYLRDLFLARNNLTSFEDIPPLPTLRRLSVAENFIANTRGLSSKKFPKLIQLTVRQNPLAEKKDYRAQVRKALPHIQVIDDITVDNTFPPML